MGDSFAKAILFQAPAGPVTSSHVIWDERPTGSLEGGVLRPFLWLERPGALTTILYFHGNAEDLMDVEPELQEMSIELMANVLAVEYPGYGLLRSSSSTPQPWAMSLCTRGPSNADTGEPTIEGIDKAAVHALAYLITTRGIPGSQVILFGRSLGSGTALRLAKYARDCFHWSVGGIVLQCPYISIKQVVSDYACAAGSLLIPTYYDNLTTLRQLCMECPVAMEPKRWVPLLILHGEQDEIIWPYHGHTLYDEAVRQGHPSVEAAFSPNATHNRWNLLEDIVKPMDKFIKAHLVQLDSRSPRQGCHTSCFGPGAQPRGHGGRSFGAASFASGRGNGFFGGGGNLLNLLVSSDREDNRRFI